MLYSLIKYFVLIVAVSVSVNAQTDPCITHLKDAGTMIEEGLYDEAIGILKSTLADCSLSDEDKIEAYKALIIAYFAIDELENADDSAFAIIKIYPNYKADKLRDPAEMIALFEKYKPQVIFKMEVFGGINTSSTEASQTYSIVSDDDTPGLANYESQTGFQIGVSTEYKLWKSLWGSGGLAFRRTSYKNSIPNVEGRTIFYKENLDYFDLPLGLTYFITSSRLRPYIKAGAQLSFLSSAVGQLSRDDISDLVDRNIQREEFMLGFFGGAGVTYDYGNLSFRLGIDYKFYPGNVNKEGTRYENLESIFRYYYLDNDFSTDLLQVNIGVVYNLGFKTTK